VTTAPNLVRSTHWAGTRVGDPVVVNLPRERRQSWVFVAHVANLANGEEWIEVRGGRSGEAKTRSFRPELIYAREALKGSRLVGQSLVDAPRLDIL
jgi:hypothetical protein